MFLYGNEGTKVHRSDAIPPEAGLKDLYITSLLHQGDTNTHMGSNVRARYHSYRHSGSYHFEYL